MAQRIGHVMFPREVMNRFPLPFLEEEGPLNAMPLRENFIERVFAYYRWTEMLEQEPTPGGLVDFHTAHKLTLMAHNPKQHTEMSRLVADAGSRATRVAGSVDLLKGRDGDRMLNTTTNREFSFARLPNSAAAVRATS